MWADVRFYRRVMSSGCFLKRLISVFKDTGIIWQRPQLITLNLLAHLIGMIHGSR